MLLMTNIFLTGCPSSNIKMVESISVDKKNKNGQGLVVAKVISSVDHTLPFNQLTIASIGSDEPDQYRLRINNETTGKNTVFSSYIPEGTYRLSSIRSYYTEDIPQISNSVFRFNAIYTNIAFASDSLGTFQVKEGKITDLGYLIYYAMIENNHAKKHVLRSSKKNQTNIAKYFYSLPESFTESEVLGWNEPISIEEKNIYESFRSEPMSFNEVYHNDQKVYFLGNLGTYLTYDGDHWDTVKIETDYDLLTMAVNPNGDKLIGSDFGSLFFKKLDEDWVELSISPKFRVFKVRHLDNNNYEVILISRQKLEIRKVTIENDIVSWSQIFSFDPQDGWRNHRGKLILDPPNRGYILNNHNKLGAIKAVRVHHDDMSNNIGIIQIGSGNFDLSDHIRPVNVHLFKYDLVKQTVSDFKESKRAIDYTIRSDSIEIGVKSTERFHGYWGRKSNETYYLKNKRKNKWEVIESKVDLCQSIREECKEGEINETNFDFVGKPIFFEDNQTIAVAKFYRLVKLPNKFSEFYRLVESKDGGNTWKLSESELPSQQCTQLIPFSEEEILLSCSGANGVMYRTPNRGLYWEKSRHHYESHNKSRERTIMASSY